MSYLRHLDAEARNAVRAAKKKASQEDKARKLARARDLLKAKEASFRKPRERDGAFLSWLRHGLCLTCEINYWPQVGRTEAAHVRRAYPEPGWRPVGRAEKPSDFRALPLCRGCHTSQHKRDSHDWYAEHGIYPPRVCEALKLAQTSGAHPIEAVQQIATEVRREHSGRRASTDSPTIGEV